MNFSRELLHVERPALALDFFLVPWDTDIFGFPVGQIERIAVLGADASTDFEAFEEWRAQQDIRLVSCRLPHDRLVESMFLEDRGFRFVEMVYSPRLDRLDTVLALPDGPQIEPATAADRAAIEEIAGTAFATGRLLLDHRIDAALSAERYRVWVRNSFENPRHAVLKAMIDDALVGFFIVEDKADGSAYWHLTAIAPGWQGRGVGTALWKGMIARHHAAGRTAVETTISAHNTPVINLYARLGFRFQPPETTFHWTAEPRITRR
jgi:RimJ/RimL family protein N-acetyltransferase